jgi:AcrR family transcriptional regulator
VTVTSILEAADRILRTDGYPAASTNRVARVAGFSVGSLYQYFRDKRAIVGALIDRELEAEAQQLRDLLEQRIDSSPREIATLGFGQLIARRCSRAYLHRTLDNHANELGATSILDHFVAAQASALSDTVQRVGARAFPRPHARRREQVRASASPQRVVCDGGDAAGRRRRATRRVCRCRAIRWQSARSQRRRARLGLKPERHGKLREQRCRRRREARGACRSCNRGGTPRKPPLPARRGGDGDRAAPHR